MPRMREYVLLLCLSSLNLSIAPNSRTTAIYYLLFLEATVVLTAVLILTTAIAISIVTESIVTLACLLDDFKILYYEQ